MCANVFTESEELVYLSNSQFRSSILQSSLGLNVEHLRSNVKIKYNNTFINFNSVININAFQKKTNDLFKYHKNIQRKYMYFDLIFNELDSLM